MKRISNAEVIERFRQIEELKENNDTRANKKINELQNKIVEELDFLVYNNVYRYKKFPNYNDLIQEGFIGLIKAARRFDYTLYPNFFKYASQRILNGVRRSAKKYDVVYNPEKVKTVYYDSDNIPQEIDDEFNLEEMLSKKEKINGIEKAIDSLPSREKNIIKNIFGISTYNPHTLRQAEDCCGLTYERIRQIKNKIIEKFKNNNNLIDLNK